MITARTQGTQRTPRTRRTPTTPLRQGAVVGLVFVVSLVPFVPLRSFLFPVLSGARPGVIRGRVELRRPPAPPERRPTVADLGAPVARDVPDLLRSVVYLESAPRGAFEANEGGRAKMDQRNVFSLSKPARFDLGRYATGRSRSVRFDKPGIVRVFCDIHSHMNAFILVFSHPFFTLTNAEGRYSLENVPSGTYNVIAWNEGTASEPKPVTIPDGGVAELDFTLR
jgi:hypothetical protein